MARRRITHLKYGTQTTVSDHDHDESHSKCGTTVNTDSSVLKTFHAAFQRDAIA